MIYITGDIHGDPERFAPEQLARHHIAMGPGDTIIICGDFGLPWSGPDDERDRRLLDFLEAQAFTVLFIDGNHENFDLLEAYPVRNFRGGRVHQLRRNIYHLMRGEIFTIEGLDFFCFGGAHSVDQAMREEHRSWWPRELLNEADQERARQNLARYHYRVDYVLTHTAPLVFLQERRKEFPLTIACPVRNFLTGLEPAIQYTHWYFGHFHQNYVSPLYRCTWLYRAILPIGGTGND